MVVSFNNDDETANDELINLGVCIRIGGSVDCRINL
jgi:hypothetical protein